MPRIPFFSSLSAEADPDGPQNPLRMGRPIWEICSGRTLRSVAALYRASEGT